MRHVWRCGNPRIVGDSPPPMGSSRLVVVVSPQRIRDDIVRLSHRGVGVRQFAFGTAQALRRGVAHDGFCLLTMDPATLLPTGEVVENGLPAAATDRMTQIELLEPDFNKFVELARRQRPAASLSHVTNGVLDRSRRHRELKRLNGFGDELRAACVGDSGTWGAITLLREAGSGNYTPADVSLLAALSPYLAEGLRRAILLTALTTDSADAPGAVGMVLLDDDSSIEIANSAAREFLDELGADEHLPVVVRAVAARARGAASGDSRDEEIARARVQTPSGRWLIIRGSMLGQGSEARAAVMIEPAGSAELAPLLADAYGLTERERRVTQLVAQGRLTRDIAAELHLSHYTVQDHLKAIFEKVGVGSRGELVAQLFFEHYLPRLTRGTPVDSNGWFKPNSDS
jgi:DNA-binding NarL/FixJ family response regulator